MTWEEKLKKIKEKRAALNIIYAQADSIASHYFGNMMREASIEYSIPCKEFVAEMFRTGLPVFIAVNKDGKMDTFPFEKQAIAFTGTGTGTSKTLIIRRVLRY